MNKKTIRFGLIIVALGLLAWFAFGQKKTENKSQNQNNSQNSQQQDNTANADDKADGIVGKLLTSDTASRGNLMVVTSDKTLYIRTSRDFSDLIGRQVRITIDGTPDNFRLLDIVAN